MSQQIHSEDYATSSRDGSMVSVQRGTACSAVSVYIQIDGSIDTQKVPCCLSAVQLTFLELLVYCFENLYCRYFADKYAISWLGYWFNSAFVFVLHPKEFHLYIIISHSL